MCVCVGRIRGMPPAPSPQPPLHPILLLLALLYLFSYPTLFFFFRHFAALLAKKRFYMYARVCSVSFRLPGTYPGGPADPGFAGCLRASTVSTVATVSSVSMRKPGLRPCSPCDLFLKAAQLWLKQLSAAFVKTIKLLLLLHMLEFEDLKCCFAPVLLPLPIHPSIPPSIHPFRNPLKLGLSLAGFLLPYNHRSSFVLDPSLGNLSCNLFLFLRHFGNNFMSFVDCVNFAFSRWAIPFESLRPRPRPRPCPHRRYSDSKGAKGFYVRPNRGLFAFLVVRPATYGRNVLSRLLAT